MPWKDRYTISDEVSIADSDVAWPDGKRCCVLITVDLSVASGSAGIQASDLASPTAQFAAHDGLTNILDTLGHHGLRATFAVPAVMARIFGQRLREIANAGHEIAAEGLRHEDVSTLSRNDESARLAVTTQILTEVMGERPTGWFSLPRQDDPFAGGTIGPHTIELLIDAGYEYFGNGLADDVPHYWVNDFTSRRSILTLPYYYHFDDQFFLLFPRRGTGLENADMLSRNWHAEFDAQFKRGRCFQMTLHPQGSGWANRLQLLQSFLSHMRTFPGLWNPTGTECAHHWRTILPEPSLEASIWKDYPGSLS